jgi:pyruvate dehydrogenase E2 component (dihydrolipoamide acetyltransferase)
MAIQFKLPDLGEDIEEAEVLKVLVSEGDTIALEQPVIEVETDKAIFEVPSEVVGRITKIHVREDDTVEVGDVLLTVEEVAETAERVSAPAPAAESAEATAPASAAPAPPAEPQRSEEPAAAPERVATSAAAPAVPAPPPDAPPADGQHGQQDQQAPVFASPSVRQFAREIGIDIHAVPGSGPGGRISLDDVKARARRAEPVGGGAEAMPGVPPVVAPLPDFSAFGDTERERMGGVRRATAQAMALSWATIPHVTLFAKADVTALEEFRQTYRRRAEAAGGKLTLAPILLKIVAAALQAHPKLNASVDMERREAVYKRYYDIGVAVDTDRGLLVPVIRDVHQKSIIELSAEMVQVAEKAREGKLALDEMRGATFTISNLGGLGTGFFTPIINPPEVAVLGLGRAEMEPVYIDDEFQPRMRMPLSLSHDHRLVDGADGARFMRWIIQACSDPLLLALGG